MTEHVKVPLPNGTIQRLDALAERHATTKEKIARTMLLYSLDIEQQNWELFHLEESRERQRDELLEAAQDASRIIEGDDEVPDGMEKDEYIDMESDEIEDRVQDMTDSLGEKE